MVVIGVCQAPYLVNYQLEAFVLINFFKIVFYVFSANFVIVPSSVL